MNKKTAMKNWLMAISLMILWGSEALIAVKPGSGVAWSLAV